MAEESGSGSKRPRVESSMDGHPIFGDLQEKLPSKRFPTMLNVVNHVRYLKAHRLADSVRIYNSVTDHLINVWTSAYAVPLMEKESIYQSVQKYTDEKLAYVRKTSRLLKPENSGARESLISDMKRVFVISKCKCFINAETREEIVRTNCNCKRTDQIINLSCFGDQMFNLREIIIFEEEKAFFEEKLAENTNLSTPRKVHPGPSASTPPIEDEYKVQYSETARARPVSFANFDDSGLDLETERPVKYKYERLHNTIGKILPTIFKVHMNFMKILVLFCIKKRSLHNVQYSAKMFESI